VATCLLFINFTQKKYHALSFQLVITNPYFFGTSVFVFTDMLIIMLSLAAYFIYKNKKFSSFLQHWQFFADNVVIIPIQFYFIVNYNDRQINRRYVNGSLLIFCPCYFICDLENISTASGIENDRCKLVFYVLIISILTSLFLLFIFSISYYIFKKIKLVI
jgi:hypothetical protein